MLKLFFGIDICDIILLFIFFSILILIC